MENFINDLHTSIQSIYDTLVQIIDHYPEGLIKDGLLRYKCFLIKHTSFEKKIVEETCLETHQQTPFKKIAIRMSYESFKRILMEDSWTNTVQRWKDELYSRSSSHQTKSKLLMYYFPNEISSNAHRVFLNIEAYLNHFCRWLSKKMIEEIKQECHNAYYARKDLSKERIRQDIAQMDRSLVQLKKAIQLELGPIEQFLKNLSFDSLYQSLYDEFHQDSLQGGFSRTTLRKKAMDAYQFNVKYRLSLFQTIQSEYRSLSLYANKERPLLTALAMPVNFIKIMNVTIASSIYTSIVFPLKLTLMIPLLPKLAYNPIDFIRTLIT